MFGLLSPSPSDRLVAQESPPPDLGGRTYSLGQPRRFYPDLGVVLGVQSRRGEAQGTQTALFGIARDVVPGFPGLLTLRAEPYAGLREASTTAGVRVLAASPTFRLGLGMDYNASDRSIDAIFTGTLPLRRGGVFGRGSMLRLEWIPARGAVQAGVIFPTWGRAGRTRPREVHAPLGPLHHLPSPQLGQMPEALVRTMAVVREHALWIGRATTPGLEDARGGRDTSLAIDELARRQAEIGPDPHFEERAMHGAIRSAMVAAWGGDGPMVDRLTALARVTLRNRVVQPWNRLLGQKKRESTLRGLLLVAESDFHETILQMPEVPRDRVPLLLTTFAAWGQVLEAVRADQQRTWRDDRLVWIPLQLVLLPEDYATPEQIDQLVADAVRSSWTGNNQVWYVQNELFHLELERSTRAARDHHVLWIHDYPGTNEAGKPDAIAAAHTQAYLEALTERVRDYDVTGRMTSYFIFQDQHYYDINGSRSWLTFLEDPLVAELPFRGSGYAAPIEAAREELRRAVAESSLLSSRRGLFGERWLRSLVKVHVSITNPPDAAFWSRDVIPLVGLSDNIIRDHRKIVFHDLDESDPWRGEVIITGMGVGEQFASPEWEDRALVVRGPAAVGMKAALRDLLESHGVREELIPLPLRESMGVTALDKPDAAEARAMILHNVTGYGPKPINVAKAVFYTLLPPGSVAKIPDSLWQNPLFAGMLMGASVRGARVLLIAPSDDAFPARSWAALARAHTLLTRVLSARAAMAGAIAEAGGVLGVGLYDVSVGVDDLAGRERLMLERWRAAPSWLLRLLPDERILRELATASTARRPISGEVVIDTLRPKLHLKGHFIATAEGWDALVHDRDLPGLVALHRRERERQMTSRTRDIDVRSLPAETARLARSMVQRDIAEAPDPQAIGFWLLIGSANMDYRSMFLDGEVMAFVSGAAAVQGFVDFLSLSVLTTWIENQAELDALLTPPSAPQRRIANWLRSVL
ncbi:MAG: hypothetical protein U0974_14300 [Gemmatimonadales bacterium]|nr:hypothetical protein [Gemmatimonadales bacterium]MDZ4390887.1 hypothetical protein [Gemmatimonadales bacterium]